MLISLLRHGIPTSLKTRAIRNGSSTATSSGFGGSSRRKEEGIDGWTAATGADQIEKNSWKTLKHSREEPSRSVNSYPSLNSAENPKEKGDWKEDNGARSKLGYEAGSRNCPDDISPSLRNEWETGPVAHLSGIIHSKVARSVKTEPASSRSIVTESLGQSTHSEERVKRTQTYSPLIDRPSKENLIEGKDVALDDSGQPPTQNIGADSSFLDGLDDEVSEKRSIRAFQESIPVTRKLATLQRLLVAGDSRNLLMYMKHHVEDVEFIRAIPGLTFVEVIRQLQPGDDFLPLRSDYKELGPKHYWMLSGWRGGMYKALHDRRHSYHNIMMVRIESGATLAIGEYTQLLNLARSTWDGVMALDIMKDMIANGLQPNLTCYNNYFEARCWSDAYHPSENHRLRVLPLNTEMRKESPRRFVPGHMMVDGHRVEEDGIRWEITHMFTKMLNEGISADTRAYCNLIIAQSREGHLDAIKSVLKQVWNVDVDALLAGEPDYDQQTLQEDSPTYPTGDLLYTLAHAFGSNNNIPAAMQIVAHFSSKYQITISQAVWGELLEWTFVLSTPRRKLRTTDGHTNGQLPLRSVESLYNVMLNPPYHGKPTMRMYDFVLRSFWRRPRNHRTVYDFLDRMREGANFHDQAFAAFTQSRAKLGNMLKDGGVTDPLILNTQQAEVAKAWRERWYSFVLVRKWLDLILSNQKWLRNVRERENMWTRKMVPDIINEFWRFKAHKPFIYPTATGKVALEDLDVEGRWTTKAVARESSISREMEDWESGWATWSGTADYVQDPDAERGSFGTDDEAEVREYLSPQEQEDEEQRKGYVEDAPKGRDGTSYH